MTDFLGLDLHTTKETFIPRPETELLVEVCLGVMQELQADSPLHILDIGTGTGNIAIPLTKIRRDCKIVALDKSEEALAVAGKNAEKFGVLDKIEFVTSDIFSSLARARKFDIIVSNPPYVSTWEIATLSDCVKDEPRMALDGGVSQFVFVRGTPDDVRRATIRVLDRFASHGGLLIGPTQKLTEDVPLENALAFFDAVRQSEESSLLLETHHG